MQTINIHPKLHQYIGNEDDGIEYVFTDEDLKLFDERRARRLTGESKTYNWQQAKNIVTGKKSL